MGNPSSDSQPLTFTHRFIPGTLPNVTLLLLHGTGGNEDSLLDLGAELLPGASILSPRGKVLENGMPRFFRRLSEGVFDEEDLHFRTTELVTFIDAATAAYGLDRNKIYTFGYSNGANIAASILLSHPNVLAGSVLMRAMVPFEPLVLPSLPPTPILLMSGDRDPLISHHNANRLYDIFKLSGADVRHTVAHAGHALTEPELQIVQQFFVENLAAV